MEQNNYEGKWQQPVGSGFNRYSTAQEVLNGADLSGKTAIVTGGHSGLGLELSKTLAAAGATVIVAARDMIKAATHLSGISNIELEPLELTEPDSINAFAEKFLATGRPLHLLFNNAGIMWTPLWRDSRGYEAQFSTNHLGHFQLTAKLWSALKKAAEARVINTSSWGHHASPVDFNDPNFNHRSYNAMQAYGQSKTANILFAAALDSRGRKHNVRAYSIHPGLILTTDLARSVDAETKKALGMTDAEGNPVHRELTGVKNVEQGIATHIWCATSPALETISGVYCENADIAPLDVNYDPSAAWVEDIAQIKGVMPFALEEAAAQKLWAISEQLTGTTFNLH